MKINKAFTLSEILIVLIVIGVISSMVVPSVIKGTLESRYIAGYKKACNTMVNLIAMEAIGGNISSVPSKEGVAKLYNAINTGTIIKGYADLDSSNKYDGSSIISANDYKNCVTYMSWENKVLTHPENSADLACAGSKTLTDSTPWVVNDDNIAYSVTIPNSKSCETREVINSKKKFSDAYNASCAVIVVDTNGLHQGPNIIEPQLSDDFNPKNKLKQLSGDRYYIFVGRNGATAGSEYSVLTGRIIANLR